MSLSLEKPKTNVGATVVSLIKRTNYTIDLNVPLANWFQRVLCVILDWFIAVIVGLAHNSGHCRQAAAGVR